MKEAKHTKNKVLQVIFCKSPILAKSTACLILIAEVVVLPYIKL